MGCHRKAEALLLRALPGMGLNRLKQHAFAGAFSGIRETQFFAEPKNRGASSVVMLDLGFAVTVSSDKFRARGSWYITKHECLSIAGK